MKTVSVMNKELEINMTLIREDLEWTEALVQFIDVLKGHGYVGQELDEIQDSIMLG